MVTDALNPSVVKIELNRVFFEEYDGYAANPGFLSVQNGKIFKTVAAVGNTHTEQTYGNSGYFKKIGETQAVPLETPIASFKRSVAIADFGSGVEISRNFFTDDQHYMYDKVIRDFARTAIATQEKEGAKLFRDAFAGTLTNDDSAWGGSHKTINGGAVTTILTDSSSVVNPTLSATSLFDAIVELQKQPNQGGVAVGSVAKYLIVPTALYKRAIEITESEKLADTANNNVNIYSMKYGIEVYQSHFIGATFGGSDTAWFLLSDRHSVQRIVREGLVTSLRDWTVSNNRTYLYQAYYREEYFVSDFFGSIMSKGTNAA